MKRYLFNVQNTYVVLAENEEQAREMLAQVMSHARETAQSKPSGGAIRSLSAYTSSPESKAA